MTDGVQLQLIGDRDIVAALKDLREYLPRDPLRNAVKQAAQFLADFIALAAPRLIGRLARNIVVKTKKTQTTIRGEVAVNTIGDRYSDANAFYWRFLEEGFHTARGSYRKFPWIAGVLDSKQAQAAQQVIDECGKAITRAEEKARNAGGF